MRDSRTASRKIALCAMLMALAMIFSYVEVLIPINLGVPGIKLGIANLVVVVGLFFLPAGEVLMISVARILLMGYLFGNGMSILYSLAGGLLSFLVMFLLKHIKGFSITGVSIAGGVTHNVAQICVAALVVQNRKLFYYLPALLVAGVITGMLIGILSDRILSAVKRGRVLRGRYCTSSTIYLCGDKNRSANFKKTYKLIIKILNKQYLCAFEKKYSVKS